MKRKGKFVVVVEVVINDCGHAVVGTVIGEGGEFMDSGDWGESEEISRQESIWPNQFFLKDHC